MPRVSMWLNIYNWETVWRKLTNRQKMHFLCCFWAYIWQPHDHICWVTPMSFASINHTNPRTNPWPFCKKMLRIGDSIMKISVFLSWPFWKRILFCFIPMKGWVEILVMTLVSSQKSPTPNISAPQCIKGCVNNTGSWLSTHLLTATWPMTFIFIFNK